MPLAKRAARNYIAGDTLADAQRVRASLAVRELQATIGFWDADHDTAREVADQYLAGLEALAVDDQTTYLSMKLPALDFSAELLDEVAERARAKKRRIHLDALAPETVDRTRAAVDALLARMLDVDIGCTLPGRWRRSPNDAHWASDQGLCVRVVKGEWPDPREPQRNPRAGFLEVIDALAGRARRVGVATHDVALGRAAIRRLQAAGTPCSLELLYGLPMRVSIRDARELGIDVRVYVPYGEAYMPYALSQIRRRPRTLLWLLNDLVAGSLRRRATPDA
jgi:proline dehydrogenase